jgi:hypothetical protein
MSNNIIEFINLVLFLNKNDLSVSQEKYLKHYVVLIDRSVNRQLCCYSEKHHIIPKCLGGKNDNKNISVLTPEEHYVAHQFLVKIFPKNRKLIFAASKMCQGRKGNKYYSWLRKLHSETMKTRIISEETRKKQSENNKGIKNNRYGKPSVMGMLGKQHSVETKQQISNSNKKYWDNNPQRKEELSLIQAARNEERIVSDNTKQKHSDNRKNSKWMSNHLNKKSSCVMDKYINDYLSDGWVFGNFYSSLNGSKWMSNIDLQKSKPILAKDFQTYIDAGWVFGRKY